MYIIKKQWSYIKPPIGSTIDWSHPLSRGLVGCWLMNEAGGLIVNDLSGNNNRGNLSGATWKSTKKGKAIYFVKNSNHAININNAFSKISNNIGTFVIYIENWDSLDTYGAVFFGTNTTTNVYFQISPTNGSELTSWGVVWGASSDANANNFLNNRAWQFVFTSNGTAAGKNFYANGKRLGTPGTNIPNSFASGAKNFQLGKWIGGIDWDFEGKIIYAMFYNRALSPSEIQALYEAPYQMVQPIRTRFYSIAASGDTSTPVAIGGFRRNFLTLGCG